MSKCPMFSKSTQELTEMYEARPSDVASLRSILHELTEGNRRPNLSTGMVLGRRKPRLRPSQPLQDLIQGLGSLRSFLLKMIERSR